MATQSCHKMATIQLEMPAGVAPQVCGRGRASSLRHKEGIFRARRDLWIFSQRGLGTFAGTRSARIRSKKVPSQPRGFQPHGAEMLRGFGTKTPEKFQV